jgi:hypothetical protein
MCSCTADTSSRLVSRGNATGSEESTTMGDSNTSALTGMRCVLYLSNTTSTYSLYTPASADWNLTTHRCVVDCGGSVTFSTESTSLLLSGIASVMPGWLLSTRFTFNGSSKGFVMVTCRPMREKRSMSRFFMGTRPSGFATAILWTVRMVATEQRK